MEKKKNNVISVAVKIVSVILLVLAVLMMLLAVYNVAFVDKQNRSIFGIRGFVVLSDSMKATDFSAGDLIFCKETDLSKLREGDIITFVNKDFADGERFGQTITHKIRQVKSADGQYAFVTYGTSNTADDTWRVTGDAVYGKYLFHIPYFGTVVSYLKSAPGYVLCILLPFMLLIGLQAANSVRLFRKYKKEQSDALAAEQARMEKEREESRRMLEELQRLKAELQEKNGDLPGGDAPAQDAPSANTEK